MKKAEKYEKNEKAQKRKENGENENGTQNLLGEKNDEASGRRKMRKSQQIISDDKDEEGGIGENGGERKKKGNDADAADVDGEDSKTSQSGLLESEPSSFASSRGVSESQRNDDEKDEEVVSFFNEISRRQRNNKQSNSNFSSLEAKRKRVLFNADHMCKDVEWKWLRPMELKGELGKGALSSPSQSQSQSPSSISSSSSSLQPEDSSNSTSADTSSHEQAIHDEFAFSSPLLSSSLSDFPSSLDAGSPFKLPTDSNSKYVSQLDELKHFISSLRMREIDSDASAEERQVVLQIKEKLREINELILQM